MIDELSLYVLHVIYTYIAYSYVEMKHTLDRKHNTYLSFFSSDNPEAVNIMNITNTRALVAKAAVHP